MSDTVTTASFGRRVLALLVDWGVSWLVVLPFVDPQTGGPESFVVLAVYVVQSTLFTWLLAGSFGKIATRLRVVPADGVLRPHRLWMVLVRQLMVALVIPPLVFRPDGRGLHDVVAGTSTVTVDTYREMVARQAR